MSEKLANRLLTLAETGGTARRYHVGIASVSRRCVADEFPGLTGQPLLLGACAGMLVASGVLHGVMHGMVL